ncbi:MAG: type II secretion system GspH family protein [Campylobacter sp.]|uniref:type II secretion system protein n=1 Tax=Campylobacter sp. TaxID=205 RepID=UPI002A3A9A3A|nr:type II secretion system protein [Campylobacter sp.]MCI6344600.1 type II secretion system GspH family protein [Campylobacter sp.]MDD6925803.1 type II secretion system protein [Campylobacteraceae bacterium]
MKKGFTMIELIFVIVILGILASVAIPRLAATREDAEISAAVANLRTLVSDATAYYTAKGTFDTNTKWNEITNVPLAVGTDAKAVSTSATAHLKVGGKNCIGVHLVNKATTDTTTTPAHIKFTKDNTNQNNGTCKQVLASDPLKPYFASKVGSTTEAIAIGSSTSVYTTK